MTSGIDIAIENLKTNLNEINLNLSGLRKKGFDTKIAVLKAMNIPFKIKLAEVTKSYKDIEKINNMLTDVKNEIISIAEDDNPAKIGNDLDSINILISKINDTVKEKRPEEAKDYYLKAVRLYKNLKDADKKSIFDKLNQVRNKLV